MQSLILEILFIIILSLLFGIIIGYALAKSGNKESAMDHDYDLDVDATTGIVSDDSHNQRN